VEARKIYGNGTITLNDSMRDDLEPGPRRRLKQSFGFNQKRIDFLNPPFYGCINDYASFYNSKNWNILPYSD
jgi:hypothetical protein